MNLNRMMAIMRARFREFYRDKASWSWNLAMPVLIIIGFAFIFSDQSQDVFKVALIQGEAAPQFETLLNTPHIRFVEISQRDKAIVKVQRHQYDMLLDLSEQPARYWINQYSSKGFMLEKILQQSLQSGAPARLSKEVVSGRDIRYVDWVMPGILAMNMMFSCLWGVGWVVVRYRKNGVLRRLQATPLTALEFLSAQVIARMIIVTGIAIAVFIGADVIVDFTMRGSYLTLFIVFFIGAACLTSMGLMVATRLKTEEVADGLLNLISWPMMIFSGVWFSMEGAHPVAQFISQLFPLTHLVNAARRVMIDGAGLADVSFEITLLAGLTIVLMLLSARLFRWS